MANNLLWYAVTMYETPVYPENRSGWTSGRDGSVCYFVVPVTKSVWEQHGDNVTMLGTIVGDPHEVVESMTERVRDTSARARAAAFTKHGIDAADAERLLAMGPLDARDGQAPLARMLDAALRDAHVVAEAELRGASVTFDYVDRRGVLHTVPGTFGSAGVARISALEHPGTAALGVKLGIVTQGVDR